jgi:hypothetical protein
MKSLSWIETSSWSESLADWGLNVITINICDYISPKTSLIEPNHPSQWYCYSGSNSSFICDIVNWDSNIIICNLLFDPDGPSYHLRHCWLDQTIKSLDL